jgi:CRISPR-associated protein Csx10
VAINRRRQTHEESQLYSVSAIDAGTVFMGIATVDPSQLDSLLSCLSLIQHLGGRSSRGFGEVTVSAKRIPAPPSVSLRAKQFNDRYRTVLADFSSIALGAPTLDDRKSLFTVTLRSDTVLRRPEGLPSTELTAAMLANELQALAISTEERDALGEIDLSLVSQHTRSIILSGWNIKWKLPKETLLATRMGSVYVFEAIANDAARESLYELLARLEHRGLGEFREDGYGQISICDEFHLEVEPV